VAICKQTSFASGEVSPKYHQRSDIEAYETFVDTCENMYPLVSGAVTRRPAVNYFDSTTGLRFVEFVFNNQQALLLVFGDLTMRVYNRSGAVLSGGSPYSLTTPYGTSTVEAIKTTQINDVVYICHPSFQPRKLTRLADNNWTIGTVSFIDGAYESINTTDTTLTISGSGLTHTMTASASLFTANDVGRLVRFESPSTGVWLWGTITAYTSATVVTWTAAPNQTGHTGTTTIWRLGAFYTGNYPSNVVYHQNRLWYANTPKLPSSGWGSQLNQLDSFAPSSKVGSADNVGTTNAIFFTLASAVASSIQFMVSDTALVIGTESGLFSSNIDTITPSSFSMALSSAIPLSDVQPIIVENNIICVSRLRNQIYGFTYVDEKKGYASQDLTLYWSHIFNKRVKRMRYVSNPTPLIWFVFDDGSLASMTYHEEQKIIAVARHSIASSTVQNLCVLPNSTTGFDELWVMGTRSGTKFISIMAREYDASFFGEDKAISARYADLYIKYDGTATDTFTGATHLANETCSYIADGIVGQVAVNGSGGFTLPFEASVVAIGLPYTSTLKTIDVGATVGEAQGLRKRIQKVKVSFWESMYCYAQALFNRPDPQYSVDTLSLTKTLETGTAKTPRTGTTESQGISCEDSEGIVLKLWIDEPLPLTITAIFFDFSATQI
jgi:hypothetical protein